MAADSDRRRADGALKIDETGVASEGDSGGGWGRAGKRVQWADRSRRLGG